MKTVTRLALAFALVASLVAPSAAFAADTSAPTAVAPKASFITASSLGTSTFPVRVTWSGSDDVGVTKYALQQSTDGGAWVNVALSSAAATRASRSLSSGHYYQFRVYAYDAAGNRSAPADGPKFRGLAFQETSGYISFSSSWSRYAKSGAFGGYVKISKVAGGTATFTFSGRSVAWVSPKDWSGWMADVWIDGVHVPNAGDPSYPTVDLYSGSALNRRVVFAKNWYTYGTHTLKIRVANAVNPYHPNVYLDAILTLK